MTNRVTTAQATTEYAVRIDSSPRTFPRRSTDYTVLVADSSGSAVATCLVGSERTARRLANQAWVNLRAGVDPKFVWNV